MNSAGKEGLLTLEKKTSKLSACVNKSALVCFAWGYIVVHDCAPVLVNWQL